MTHVVSTGSLLGQGPMKMSPRNVSKYSVRSSSIQPLLPNTATSDNVTQLSSLIRTKPVPDVEGIPSYSLPQSRYPSSLSYRRPQVAILAGYSPLVLPRRDCWCSTWIVHDHQGCSGWLRPGPRNTNVILPPTTRRATTPPVKYVNCLETWSSRGYLIVAQAPHTIVVQWPVDDLSTHFRTVARRMKPHGGDVLPSGRLLYVCMFSCLGKL